MKKTVHDSRARLRALRSFLLTLGMSPAAFEVSDVKGDGTVFVRFRSVDGESSNELGERFQEALEGHGLPYMMPEVTKFRIELARFSPETV